MATKEVTERLSPVVDYDCFADVLYISLGRPTPDEGEDQPRGVVLRYSIKDDKHSGVTVVGFRLNHWDRDMYELSKIVGGHLSVDPTNVRRSVEEKIKRTPC
ncbi:MAG: hypothetical protein ACYC0Z_16905 [Acidobacteriaceae bacterium]